MTDADSASFEAVSFWQAVISSPVPRAVAAARARRERRFMRVIPSGWPVARRGLSTTTDLYDEQFRERVRLSRTPVTSVVPL
ncbi:hypothetical protein GCM10023079_48390 [Streptomyces chitinivorans]